MNIVSLLFISVTTVSMTFSRSETEADDVIGIYWSPKKDGQIEIYRRGVKYYGKTIVIKNHRKDYKNPDPTLRTRDLIGLEFLQNFEFDGEREWINGTIYDPDTGNTYNCKMWLENGNLTLKGYFGITLIGRSETLERVK